MPRQESAGREVPIVCVFLNGLSTLPPIHLTGYDASSIVVHPVPVLLVQKKRYCVFVGSTFPSLLESLRLLCCGHLLVNSTPMQTNRAFDSFITYCQVERHCEPSTVSKYRDCFNTWLLPWLGKVEVSEITKVAILQVRQAMVEKELSIARQYSVIMCLKSLVKFCRTTLNLVVIDPSEIKLPSRKAPQVEYLNSIEIQRILDAIETQTFTGIRLRTLIEVLLSTGMRISEALSLKRFQFEDGSREAEIIGKGKRRRTVFFTERCRVWVRNYLQRRIDEHPSLFITTGYPARPLKREDISRFFRNLKARAGITKKLTPHIIRHTFCTTLRNNGADISYIKELAGHQDIQTTARYYLGSDKNKLRQIVATCLDYGVTNEERRPTLLQEEIP
jgi:integrase/recombinase XerD